MILEGSKILLRYPNEGDIDILLKWENDPLVWEVSDNKNAYSRSEMEQFVIKGQEIIGHKQLRMMICDSEKKQQLGCVDLFEYDHVNRRAGVGILIYKDSDRNKGNGSEALSLICHYAKDALGLNQLFCHILESNETSLRLFKKTGFEIIGIKKKWRWMNDSWLDEYMLQILLDK